MKKNITPLSPHFGASIENIDLSNNLSNDDVLVYPGSELRSQSSSEFTSLSKDTNKDVPSFIDFDYRQLRFFYI